MDIEETKIKKEIEITSESFAQPIEPREIKIKKNKIKTERIVIIGGGFAGVRAALDLLRSKKNIYITLVDKNLYHSYHPDYYEIASAAVQKFKDISFDDILDLKQTAAIPFFEIFGKYKNIEILKDEAVNIDLKNSFIGTQNGYNLFYDYLVIAAGSKTRFYDIKKLADFAFEFNSINDALSIKNNILELFGNKPKKEKIKIIIGGAGFSGCELAAEIAIYLKFLYKIYSRPSESAEIEIIEISENILPGVSAWARKKVMKRFEKLGIKIGLNLRIQRTEARKIFFENKEIIEFDMFIWTAGVEAQSVSKLFPKEFIEEKKFCLKTDKYLNVAGIKNVFAAGDIAYVLDNKNSPLQMTAQTAISEGRYAAAAIKKRIDSKKLFPYKPIQSKFIIPLGAKYAVADLGFIKFSGFLAWMLKHIITLKYFLSILPAFYAANFWIRGFRIYIKNDKP